VALLNDDGEMYVFTADTQGRVYLIDALSGKIIFTKRIGANFESSPIVVDNHIVLGSRGRKIYKMTIVSRSPR
jgi:outer membrane protein assembly factor BamB